MIRKITLLLLIIFSSKSIIAQSAKKGISSGKIVFEISYPETVDEERAAMFPKNSTLYFKDEMTKVEVSMMGGKTIIISNNKTESATMLMNMMGKKMQIDMSKDDLEKQKGGKGKPQVEKTKETKLICGYKCSKAVVSFTTEKGTGKFDVWYTNDLNVKNSYATRIEGIDGFMLEFSSIENGMNMKMTAISVDPIAVDDSEFVIPDGYEKTTLNDLYKSGGKK